MIDPRDLYTYTTTQSLVPSRGGTAFGTSIIQYEIRRYLDVRNLGSANAYQVTLRQRLVIPNQTAFQPGPQAATSYSNYPAIITNQVNLAVAGGGTVLVKDFFPKTLNSAISTSATTNASGTLSTQNEATSGSSSSNTNTFGVHLSGGFFGPAAIFDIGADYSHSWEKGTYDSATQGHSHANETGASQAAVMSIKDWSAYGFADNNNQFLTWIWGQSYPWDAIQDNFGSNNNLSLPDYVQARLLGTTGGTTPTNFVMPPSQLSLFGVDFTMMAGWLVAFPEAVTASEAINFTHATTCYLGGHSLSGTTIAATLDTANLATTANFSSPDLAMSTYALDPIANAGANNGAAIGFDSNPFTIAPTAAGTAFKIVSPSNNLQVTGAGFDPTMTADFSTAASLNVAFKVVDRTSQFALLLMHWLGAGSAPCKLIVTVNHAAPITVYVDAAEGEGGQNNVTSIELRNSDFTSLNYHDYLVLGLNKVTIDIAPTAATGAYRLFALAVGQA